MRLTYRYICTQEGGEFVVAINPKALQYEIIRAFPKAANEVFGSLTEEQKNISVKNANLPT